MKPTTWKVTIGQYTTWASTLAEAGSVLSNTFDEDKLPEGLVITIEKLGPDDE